MPRGYLWRPRREQLCPLSLNLPSFHSFISKLLVIWKKTKKMKENMKAKENIKGEEEEEIMGKCIFKHADT